MPNFPLPPGNPQPLPADLAELLATHDYGLITASLMGPARHLLPRARLQRSWSLQERLRDARFPMIRLPCTLVWSTEQGHHERPAQFSDTLFIPLDLDKRGTLHRKLVRLAREFQQERIWAGKPETFLRLIEVQDEIPLASQSLAKPEFRADGHLQFRDNHLQCDDMPEWLIQPDNWIARLACRNIAQKDWRELNISREDCR